jgi:hypothetical protein
VSQPFATPQQAEDAFYDALEERNDALMMRVWDDSPDIALLLPMQPFIHGGQVRNAIRDLLRSDVPLGYPGTPPALGRDRRRGDSLRRGAQQRRRPTGRHTATVRNQRLPPPRRRLGDDPASKRAATPAARQTMIRDGSSAPNACR